MPQDERAHSVVGYDVPERTSCSRAGWPFALECSPSWSLTNHSSSLPANRQPASHEPAHAWARSASFRHKRTSFECVGASAPAATPGQQRTQHRHRHRSSGRGFDDTQMRNPITKIGLTRLPAATKEAPHRHPRDNRRDTPAAPSPSERQTTLFLTTARPSVDGGLAPFRCWLVLRAGATKHDLRARYLVPRLVRSGS
jgi:hypothetical protein